MGFYTVNCFSIENVNWKKEPLFDISEHTIDIWRIRIPADEARIKYLSSFLNPDELIRSNRYHHEKDRRRFITSRSSLRRLLGRYLKKQPGDIEFALGPNKKPYLKQPVSRMQYNTSHVDNCVLIVIANTEIGIDVERTDTDFDWKEILHSTFSIEEIAWVEESKDPRHSFYLLWTRKEALAKATGKGLQDDLSIFPSLDGSHPLNGKDFLCSWEVGSFEVDSGTVGGVAYPPSINNYHFFDLDIEKS